MEFQKQREFDVAMRFYLRQLERPNLNQYIRNNYMTIAREILKSHEDFKGYRRYSWLLSRFDR